MLLQQNRPVQITTFDKDGKILASGTWAYYRPSDFFQNLATQMDQQNAVGIELRTTLQDAIVLHFKDGE